MARRELLTEDERVSLFGVPTERAALARHYTLRPDDLDFLAGRRGDANRLGAATWMALLRHPGFGLRHDEPPPRELIAYLADQLGLSEALFAVYGGRAKTRLEHGWEVAAHLGGSGRPLNEIGRAIQAFADRGRYTLVRNLASHGVGTALHEDPTEIATWYEPDDRRRIGEASVFTIEPFLSTGAHWAEETGDGWTLRAEGGHPTVQYEHTLVATRRGPVVVTLAG
jgi:hypothetical protein